MKKNEIKRVRKKKLTTNPVCAAIIAFSSVFKSSAIFEIPGANAELAKGLRIAIPAMTAMLESLVREDQLRGWVLSDEVKVTHCAWLDGFGMEG